MKIRNEHIISYLSSIYTTIHKHRYPSHNAIKSSGLAGFATSDSSSGIQRVPMLFKAVLKRFEYVTGSSLALISLISEVKNIWCFATISPQSFYCILSAE